MMNCPSCGKELFDNGEERFRCPFCGAEVLTDKAAAEETPEERCQRLEHELARQKVKTEIEALSAADHFWTHGNLFSMLDRQAARNALERGDIEAARKHLSNATKAFNIGCIVLVIVLIVIIVLSLAAVQA